MCDRHARLVHGHDGFARRRFTTADVRAMVAAEIIAPDEKVELVEGELFPVGPKQHDHESVRLGLIKALHRALFATNREDLQVGAGTTLHLAPDTFVDPDVSLLPASIRTDAAKPTDLLLCVEIATDSFRFDREKKAPLYARAGVPLLWLIDVARAETWVHALPKGDAWGAVVRVDAASPLLLPAVPGFNVTLAALR